MLEKTKERTMGSVMMVPCRSYSARAFDGCPGCVGAALEAIGQAGLYVLGRSAPAVMGGANGPLEMEYRLHIRLLDQAGTELGSDQLDAEQKIELMAPADEFADPSPDAEMEVETDDGLGEAAGMRLEDFQTVLDRIQLAPAGGSSAAGVIAGRLFGFEREIGQFQIEVCPA